MLELIRWIVYKRQEESIIIGNRQLRWQGCGNWIAHGCFYRRGQTWRFCSLRLCWRSCWSCCGFTGDAVYNLDAIANSQYCVLTNSSTFLASVLSNYADRWWNFGLMWAYIAFNVAAALFLYWVVRVPKKWSISERALAADHYWVTYVRVPQRLGYNFCGIRSRIKCCSICRCLQQIVINNWKVTDPDYDILRMYA